MLVLEYSIMSASSLETHICTCICNTTALASVRKYRSKGNKIWSDMAQNGVVVMILAPRTRPLFLSPAA